ncbi:MAG TPA: type II secretion system protein [Phycisphaerae bacterium]|nr:type II secretion system protein [Phycisphaerae bacterium]
MTCSRPETRRSPERGAGSVRRYRAGFTLIELLVVVSIIALLIAILMPSLRGARDQAKKVRCMANLRAIGIALRTYADDNRQEMPGYNTVGRHGFRITPRTRLTPSAAEESWGLQAVLEVGQAAKVLPNGLAYPVPVDKPMYMPGDSAAWVCPANPGLKDWEGQWAKWGNTYMYRMNSGGTYNIDRLATGAGMWKSPLVWDNYRYLPGESGFIGPFNGPGYRIEEENQRPPHRTVGLSSRSSTAYWIAVFADGHCQQNGMNKAP